MTEYELIFDLLITEDIENLLMVELDCNVDGFVLQIVEDLVEQLNGNQVIKRGLSKNESIVEAFAYGTPNDEVIVELIYDTSIAIAELHFLRFGLDKKRIPIDFKRFCNVLIEKNKLISFDIPLVMALKYCFEILQSSEIASEKLLRIGNLRSSAHTAMLNTELIYSNASQFDPIIKNSNVPAEFIKIEPEVRTQIQSIMKIEPNSGRLRMKTNEWIERRINNSNIFNRIPDKWLDRIIREENYFIKMLNQWP